MKKTIVLFFIFGCLTACCTTHTLPDSISSPETGGSSNTVEVKLSEAAMSVSRSLNELKSLEKTVYPPSKPLPRPTSSILDKLVVSVDWSGPVEPLLKRIAAQADFKLSVLGRRPAMAALVSITEHRARLSSIIRNIDVQLGKQGDIAVYPAKATIELRYAKL